VRGYFCSSESSIRKTPLGIFHDLIVPNANDTVAEHGKVRLALAIGSILGVLAAVDLDDEVPPLTPTLSPFHGARETSPAPTRPRRR
jgi:hypothetical protein